MKHILGLFFIIITLFSCDNQTSEELSVVMLQPNENDMFYWEDSITVQANIFNAQNLSSYKIQIKGVHADTANETFIAFNNTLQVGTINPVGDISIKNTFYIPGAILPGKYQMSFFVLSKDGSETSKSHTIYIRSLEDSIQPNISITSPLQYESITTNSISCKADILDKKSDLSDGKIHHISLWVKSLNNVDERYLIRKWTHKDNFASVYNSTTGKFNFTFNKPAKITVAGNYAIQIEARDEYYNTNLQELEIAFQ